MAWKQKRAAVAWVVFVSACAALFAGAAPSPAPRSIVLITLDTTRADHLGAWGWPHARTPVLDALAARGARFARCDTAAPVTLPSHATLLTGLYPPRHGVRDNGTFVLAGNFETVAERLAARGWDTAAVVSAVVLARRHGLAQGFRLYEDDLGAGYAAGTEVSERTAEAATDAALAAAGKLKPPYFLWVHYFDPHRELRPPSRFADAAAGPHRLYDGEIAFMDEQIGRLLAGLPKDAAVVVVGDHGEMLGEHGEEEHGLLLYSGARRVPLLVAGPGIPAGRTVDCLVRTADVAPTLLTLAGAPVPTGLDGEDLLPLLRRGSSCDRMSYTESFLPFFSYKWYPLRALSTDRFLYVHGPAASLYQLPSDPAEKDDLGSQQPAALKLWERRLRDLLKRSGEELDAEVRAGTGLTAEERQRLASLGYAGGSSGGAVGKELPDPRRMMDVKRALDAAADKVQQGRCPEALPGLQDVIRRDPRNVPALNLAGACLQRTGRHDAALALYQRAEREDGRSAVPVAGAADSLLALGRKQEAEAGYRRALELDPALGEAAVSLARLLRERGDRAGALRVLDAAVEAGSRTAGTFLARGTVRAEAGRLAEALPDFREAARRSPTDPVPLESAAQAAFQLGRPQEAVQLYEQILRLQPNRLDAWKTAGAIYFEALDDRDNALRCFRRALTLEADPGERARLAELIAGLE